MARMAIVVKTVILLAVMMIAVLSTVIVLIVSLRCFQQWHKPGVATRAAADCVCSPAGIDAGVGTVE